MKMTMTKTITMRATCEWPGGRWGPRPGLLAHLTLDSRRVVLPDRDPATSTGNAVSPAPAPSKPGLRDSAFSMESGEDYVNVPESEESADASLNGSREYVNVSQELQPGAKTKPDTQNSQEVEDEEAPDYENL